MKTPRCSIITLLTFMTLTFVTSSFAQNTASEYVVWQIYFHPIDRQLSPEIDATLDRLVKDVQQFYADEMERHGFGRKTFRLKTDASGRRVRYNVKGKFPAIDYQTDRIGKAHEEIREYMAEHVDLPEHYFLLVFIDGGYGGLASSQVGGNGGGGPFGGTANILLLDFHLALESLYSRAFDVIGHEMGHAFGLLHDFRDDRYMMSYGDDALRDRLSYCAAKWLDAHRYFNTTQSSVDRLPTIEMLPPIFVSPPNTIRLQFKITHSARLHQAQLLTNSLVHFGNPSFDPTTVIDCKSLNANSTTVEFVTTELAPASEYVQLQIIDIHGNFTNQRFSINITALLPDSEPVSIPDANLAALIRKTLGLRSTSPITRLDMLGLGELHYYEDNRSHFGLRPPPGKQITDLTGLQHATNLEKLRLNDHLIVDLTPLAGLTKLRSLILPRNQISDVSPVEELTLLSSLWLDQNQISDITPLTRLTRLTTLFLGGNKIADLTPLAGLTNLGGLDISGNQINDRILMQLAALTEFPKLTGLSLGGNQIRDLTPLPKLTRSERLYGLSLEGNQIVDITPLEGMTGLRSLHLAWNQISDIRPLKGMTNLGLLVLQENQISDVSLLSDLVNLEFLQLVGNPISNLKPLYALLQKNPDVEIWLNDDGPLVAPKILFSPNVIANQTFTVGTYASLTLPEANGSTEPYDYTLTPDPPIGLQFDSIDRWIGGTPTTPMQTTPYTYTATDANGACASLTFTITVEDDGLNLDVNGDGQVNVIDLAMVALFYGTRVQAGISLPADVNADGIVNILDLTAVAQDIDAQGDTNGLSLEAVEAGLLAAAELDGIAEAPAGFGNPSQHDLRRHTTYQNVAEALADAAHLGHSVSAVLKELLHLLTEMAEIPETTALLPNYPNPFNPETWIPYHLSKDAAVILTIYDVRGSRVRELSLGHQAAGVYESRGRSAYWDGKNQLGEPVASGVYFYTLTAGDFTATRKMLIAK